MLKKLPPFTRNFYFLAGFFLLFWMLLLDSNDLYTQYKMRSKLNALRNEKAYYLEKIDEVEKDRQQLLTDEALFEKFAREKYLMKKESEDLYVIIED